MVVVSILFVDEEFNFGGSITGNAGVSPYKYESDGTVILFSEGKDFPVLSARTVPIIVIALSILAKCLSESAW
jgi:hypothetical protein